MIKILEEMWKECAPLHGTSETVNGMFNIMEDMQVFSELCISFFYMVEVKSMFFQVELGNLKSAFHGIIFVLRRLRLRLRNTKNFLTTR